MSLHKRWLIEEIQKYWNVTEEEALQYAETYNATEQGRVELKAILIKRGVPREKLIELRL
jgi:hypothetical protein